MSKLKRPKITLKLTLKAESPKIEKESPKIEEEYEIERSIPAPKFIKKHTYDLSSSEDEDEEWLQNFEGDDDDNSDDEKDKMVRKSKKNSVKKSTNCLKLGKDEKKSESGFLWEMLPDEIILRIGHYISASYYDLMVSRMICKRFLRIFSDVTLITLTTKQMKTIEKIIEAPYYNYSRSAVEFNPQTVISCGVGTGKTVIALNAIRKILDSGRGKKILIVAPEILFYEWKKAFERWCSNLPDLKEYHSGLSEKEIFDIDLDDYQIVLTKNGLNVSRFSSCRTTYRYYGYQSRFKYNFSKNDGKTPTRQVIKKLTGQKWDLIICDDMQTIPTFVRGLMYHLTNHYKHEYKLFSLNASDRRQKNLVNYGVDEELPPKPKLVVKVYLYKYLPHDELKIRGYAKESENATDLAFEHIQDTLIQSESKNKFAIYTDMTDRGPLFNILPRTRGGTRFQNYRLVYEDLFPGYENIDLVAGTNNKVEKLKTFESGEINSLFSSNGKGLIKGHNLYPQEVNYVLLSDMHSKYINIRRRGGYTSYNDSYLKYRKSVGLSNIYQALGRCHRTFSPHKKVYMNIFSLFYHPYLEKKLRYFFSEYFINKDDNFKKIADRINGMRVGGRVRINKDDFKKLGPKAPTLDINSLLEDEKYKNVKIKKEEDDLKVILTIEYLEED